MEFHWRPTGQITRREHPLPLDYPPSVSYVWHGGDVVYVNRRLASLPRNPKPGMLIWVGPYSLRVIDYSFVGDAVLACRERPLKTRALVACYRLTRGLDLVYRRLIITLAVWGLATYDPGRVPSWHDVVERFRRG